MDNLPRSQVPPHIPKLIARNIAHRNGNRPYADREWLRVRYEDQGMTLRQIAREAQCGLRTIARWMQTHKIPTRDNTTAIKLTAKHGPDNPNWRGGFPRCVECGKPKASRAKNQPLCLNCHYRSRVGPGNPRWKGIADAQILVRQWTFDHWRPLVFARDKYTCQSCGDSSGGNLQAHHLTPFAEIVDRRRVEWNPDLTTAEGRLQFARQLMTDPNITSVENGITLCESCHRLKH